MTSLGVSRLWLRVLCDIPLVTSFSPIGPIRGWIQKRWHIPYFDPKDQFSTLYRLSKSLHLNQCWSSSTCEQFFQIQQCLLKKFFSWVCRPKFQLTNNSLVERCTLAVPQIASIFVFDKTSIISEFPFISLRISA